jgi:hypothetical protein
MTNPNIPSRIFDAPTLRLLLFLQGSTPPSPFRRSPYHFAELLSPSNVAGAAAKTIVKVIPVMGRRSISVMLRGATTGGGSSVNVTVGGVNAGASERQIAFAAIEPATECVLIPQVSLTVGGTYKATFTDPQVQYLTFYVQRVGAASEDGVYVTVDAVD